MEFTILHWFASLHNAVLNPIMYGFLLRLVKLDIMDYFSPIRICTILPKKYRKVAILL